MIGATSAIVARPAQALAGKRRFLSGAGAGKAAGQRRGGYACNVGYGGGPPAEVRASLRDAVLGLAVLKPRRQGELKLGAALRQLVELLPCLRPSGRQRMNRFPRHPRSDCRDSHAGRMRVNPRRWAIRKVTRGDFLYLAARAEISGHARCRAWQPRSAWTDAFFAVAVDPDAEALGGPLAGPKAAGKGGRNLKAPRRIRSRRSKPNCVPHRRAWPSPRCWPVGGRWQDNYVAAGVLDEARSTQKAPARGRWATHLQRSRSLEPQAKSWVPGRGAGRRCAGRPALGSKTVSAPLAGE